MTNDERMTKHECRMSKGLTKLASSLGIRHSSFFRHSCFVIRHSLVRRHLPTADRLDQVAAVTDRRREFAVADAQLALVVCVAGAEASQPALAPDLGGAAAAVGVHVLRHQLQTVQLGLLGAEDVVEALAPAKRVGGHDGTAL